MRRTNTNSEAEDGQTSQGILDNVRLAGTVESGGGPVVLVVVRRLRDPVIGSMGDSLCRGLVTAYFPRGMLARVAKQLSIRTAEGRHDSHVRERLVPRKTGEGRGCFPARRRSLKSRTESFITYSSTTSHCAFHRHPLLVACRHGVL